MRPTNAELCCRGRRSPPREGFKAPSPFVFLSWVQSPCLENVLAGVAPAILPSLWLHQDRQRGLPWGTGLPASSPPATVKSRTLQAWGRKEAELTRNWLKEEAESA